MNQASQSTGIPPAAGAKKAKPWQRLLPFLITAACFAYLYNRLNHAAAAEGTSLLSYLAKSFENVNWYYWLAGWAIINIVISFYYYLRFIKVMYLGDRVADEQPLSLSPALRTALAVSVIGIVIIGVYPQPIIIVAQDLIKQWMH
jgi:NADH:ubiquinone oxidoreductase subunit 4 (subunit M)